MQRSRHGECLEEPRAFQERIVPILIWVILGVLAFNVLFVAARVRATQPRQPRAHHRPLAPIYATIPRHSAARRRR
jgi:hypothetical protein